MEFLVKIKCSDRLRKRDVMKDLEDGLHFIVGSGDPECEYLQHLEKVQVLEYRQPRKVKRVVKDG